MNISASRLVNNSLSVYFFLDSELSNGRMKVQVKRAFKGYFFVTKKNNKKADKLCIKFTSYFNRSVLGCLYPLFQNQCPQFLRLHLFRRISQSSGQDLQDVKRTYPQVFIITTPDRRKLPISPKQRFLKICFSPSREEEDYRAENMTKIKLARVLVTSFDIFHHFTTFTFLVSVFLCHNLDSNMLKREGSLT